MAELHSTCPEEQFEKCFFGKNFEKFFGILAINFRIYCRISLAEFSKLQSAVYLSAVKLWRIFLKKLRLSFFGTRANLHVVWKKIYQDSVNSNPAVQRNLLTIFSKKYNQQKFPPMNETFSNVWLETFVKVAQITVYPSSHLFVKLFFRTFLENRRKNSELLSENFPQESEDCNLQIQRNKSRNFFNKVLGHFENFLPMSDKKFSLGLSELHSTYVVNQFHE